MGGAFGKVDRGVVGPCCLGDARGAGGMLRPRSGTLSPWSTLLLFGLIPAPGAEWSIPSEPRCLTQPSAHLCSATRIGTGDATFGVRLWESWLVRLSLSPHLDSEDNHVC